MTELTIWQTDDCCPRCSALLLERIDADGSITQECGCGWSVTWQPTPGPAITEEVTCDRDHRHG
jgi:hypothetical protein